MPVEAAEVHLLDVQAVKVLTNLIVGILVLYEHGVFDLSCIAAGTLQGFVRVPTTWTLTATTFALDLP